MLLRYAAEFSRRREAGVPRNPNGRVLNPYRASESFAKERSMKHAKMSVTASVCVAALLPLVVPNATQASTVNIVSNTVWTVTDAGGNPLGNAQNVCLNATAPSNCPPGATLYGYLLAAWTANLSSIPGATWIWAPNITGATSSAENAEFTFEMVFYLCGPPASGTIFLGADNNAEVFINGASAARSTNSDQSVLLSVAVPASMLVQGRNVIQI